MTGLHKSTVEAQEELRVFREIFDHIGHHCGQFADARLRIFYKRKIRELEEELSLRDAESEPWTKKPR